MCPVFKFWLLKVITLTRWFLILRRASIYSSLHNYPFYCAFDLSKASAGTSASVMTEKIVEYTLHPSAIGEQTILLMLDGNSEIGSQGKNSIGN